jgi:PiT family inorganic phosphate transporter
MGVITLALIAAGHWTDVSAIPLWVKVACALAIALGTYLGGWRIIRTLGKGLVDIAPPQGMAAQSASAAVILASSHLGFALSTTHVATGSILGSGVARPAGQVRWRVAGRMVAAWLITLPAAGSVGAAMWWVGHLLGGGLTGALAVFVLLVLASGAMYWRSRAVRVDQHNVNDEWSVADTSPDDPVQVPIRVRVAP